MKHTTSTSRRRWFLCTLAVFVSSGLFALTLYARALLTPAIKGAGPVPAGAAAPPQAQPSARAARSRNLALQPAAQNFSRRVGRRFVEPGREASVLVGTLNVGSEQQRVRVERLQDDGGERIEVSLGDGRATLSWDAEHGPLSASRGTEGSERALIERLVMDSPDQFALAQLRGASYYTVARNVRPTDDGGADGYVGSLYDIIRVGEPARGDGKGWASSWRLYYVNTVTGLIEKIVSEDEGGVKVEATLSEWGTHAGETLPSRVTWTRGGGQVFMELNLNNVSHGPKQ
ncbi:MAG: hypothetical protein LC802_15930 [Acidobacteria bacterium]|nr:hypothetical protein [Acidobacteriota bacterium]